jgi:hypothetical protein
MNNRVIPALLCAAVLAFACGPHPRGDAQTAVAAPAAKPRGRNVASAAVITSALDVRTGGGVTFSLQVTNSGSKLAEVNFPSGLTHDFQVVDAAGREVWRWSRDRMFTQSLRNQQIPAGETVRYEEAMPPMDLHGGYTVVATLASTTHPITQRVSFTLP